MTRALLRPFCVLALALGLPGMASAQQGGTSPDHSLVLCADPDLPPEQTVRSCQLSLRNHRMKPAMRAAVLTNLGVAQAAQGRHGDAILSFDLAIATDPGLTVAQMNRARSLVANGRRAEAMAAWDAVIERAPREADGWLGRGALKLAEGDAAGARDDLDRAIRLKPRCPAAHFNRGLALLALDIPREALLDFETVLRATPEDAAALMHRGQARAALGRADAEADFDRAIDLDPDRGAAWLARGRWLDAQGRREEADRDLLRAYRLGVSDPWLIDRIRRLSGG